MREEREGEGERERGTGSEGRVIRTSGGGVGAASKQLGLLSYPPTEDINFRAKVTKIRRITDASAL